MKVKTFKNDLKAITKQIGNVDYVINCIAILNTKFKKEFIDINTSFPRNLSNILLQNKTKLFHISTDGVFEKDSNTVNEDDKPKPNDIYGKTKLKGESKSLNSITFRSSFLGFDNDNHRGLLEWVLLQKEIKGYTNHLWSGCTSLQFGELLENLIKKNRFDSLRKKSHVFHFAPLKMLTKYEIIQTFLKLIKQNKKLSAIKDKTEVTRQLETKYKKELNINKFSTHISAALQELIAFERIPL